MYKIIFTTLLVSLFTQAAYAANEPTTCPAVSAMTNVGVDSLYRTNTSKYAVTVTPAHVARGSLSMPKFI